MITNTLSATGTLAAAALLTGLALLQPQIPPSIQPSGQPPSQPAPQPPTQVPVQPPAQPPAKPVAPSPSNPEPRTPPEAELPKAPKPPTMPAPVEVHPQLKDMTLTSTAFVNGEQMPKKYTVDGANVSPPLAWTKAPENTKEFVLIMYDPDVPRVGGFTHWVAYGIPADVQALPEALPREPELKDPVVLMQGRSSFRQLGYLGPAARKGGGKHHYHFRLYALSAPLGVEADKDRTAVELAMKDKVIGWVELVGTNER